MRTSDIEVGREYAVGPPSARDEPLPYRRERARVLETGLTRTVTEWSSSRIVARARDRKANVSDGVRIVYLDKSGEPRSWRADDVVPSSHVLRTWEDELEVRRAREEWTERSREQRRVRAQQAERVVENLRALVENARAVDNRIVHGAVAVVIQYEAIEALDAALETILARETTA